MTNTLLLKKYFNKLKKFHNLYQKIEDSNKIANYIIEEDLDIDEFCDTEFKTIDDVQKICKWKILWNYGDLISFSSYRDTWTYIIGKEGKLIENGNYDGGAGYLTIPIEITKYLKNSKWKYQNLDYLMYLDFRYDDKFINDNFGNFKSEWNLTYTWDNHSDLFIINFHKENSTVFEINKNYQKKWIEFLNCKNKNIDKFDDNINKFIKKYLGVIDKYDIELITLCN